MSPDAARPGQFAYLHTDIPGGVTIAQWRRAHGAQRSPRRRWARAWPLRWKGSR